MPHKGDVVSQVIEGAYEVLGIFDRVEEKRDAMQSLLLPPPAQQALAKAALTYRFGEDHQPVTESQILSPRRWQDESNDLWTTYQRIQENLIKGGLSGRNVKGERTHTRAVRGIDGDVKLKHCSHNCIRRFMLPHCYYRTPPVRIATCSCASISR